MIFHTNAYWIKSRSNPSRSSHKNISTKRTTQLSAFSSILLDLFRQQEKSSEIARDYGRRRRDSGLHARGAVHRLRRRRRCPQGLLSSSCSWFKALRLVEYSALQLWHKIWLCSFSFCPGKIAFVDYIELCLFLVQFTDSSVVHESSCFREIDTSRTWLIWTFSSKWEYIASNDFLKKILNTPYVSVKFVYSIIDSNTV